MFIVEAILNKPGSNDTVNRDEIGCSRAEVVILLSSGVRVTQAGMFYVSFVTLAGVAVWWRG